MQLIDPPTPPPRPSPPPGPAPTPPAATRSPAPVGSPASASPITVRVFGGTDVGRAREHNEDAFAVANLATPTPLSFVEERIERPSDRGLVFMVADGMGGAASGELASSMAVDIVLRQLRTLWVESPNSNPSSFVQALITATTTANDRIHRHARQHPENRGMGTTATVAGMLGDMLYVAQVGDSRAYLVRKGTTRQLTKDQSLIQRLVEAGELTAEEAEVSDRRNIILQALGPEPSIKIDITRQQLRRGDTLVVCSDGLSGLVKDTDIARAVEEEHDLKAVCTRLIATANTRGGPDNITVVVAAFEGPALSEPTPADEIGHQVYAPTESQVQVTTPPEPAPVTAPTEPPTGPRPAGDQARRAAATTTLEIAPRRDLESGQRNVWGRLADRGKNGLPRGIRGTALMIGALVVALLMALAFWRLRAH